MLLSSIFAAKSVQPSVFNAILFVAAWILGGVESTRSMACAEEWTIPVAGNFFRTAPSPGDGRVGRGGNVSWSDPQEVYSVYFHVDQPAALTVSIELDQVEGDSELQATVGRQTFDFEAKRAGRTPLGSVDVAHAGYVRVDFQGVRRTGRNFPSLKNLIAESDTEGLKLHFVRNNEGNMFYWGRRGPSVHLTYTVPRDLNLEYAYSEITVPKDEDPIGSYFMANGFAEGYFGFQVNSESERRVLFSVWSPFQTDNPRDIPADQRITALAQGPEVRIGEFGNEGSGGQSYLVYPWETGQTYRFLTRVTPDGEGNTIYTAWFGDKERDEWRLIASFQRPKTDTHLRGFHSFLESFNPAYGHVHRRSKHHNVWVRDTAGQWHECQIARLSVDGTGGNGHRLDFGAGIEDDGWFMENCGFFSGQVKPGTTFPRTASSSQPPAIDFERLRGL